MFKSFIPSHPISKLYRMYLKNGEIFYNISTTAGIKIADRQTSQQRKSYATSLVEAILHTYLAIQLRYLVTNECSVSKKFTNGTRCVFV